MRKVYFIHMFGFATLWVCIAVLLAAFIKLSMNGGAVLLVETNPVILAAEVFFVVPGALAYLGYLTFFERNRLLRRYEA